MSPSLFVPITSQNLGSSYVSKKMGLAISAYCPASSAGSPGGGDCRQLDILGDAAATLLFLYFSDIVSEKKIPDITMFTFMWAYKSSSATSRQSFKEPSEELFGSERRIVPQWSFIEGERADAVQPDI